jgi:hypothetical protein
MQVEDMHKNILAAAALIAALALLIFSLAYAQHVLFPRPHPKSLSGIFYAIDSLSASHIPPRLRTRVELLPDFSS